MVASTICQIACIFMPLNSLFPVSVIMFWVAACILPYIALMWASMFPLLLKTSPRYLYFSTSSNTWLFKRILDLGPLPIFTTLHFAAPNSMWYFLPHDLLFSVFAGVLLGRGGWGIRRPSIAVSRFLCHSRWLVLGLGALVLSLFRLLVWHILLLTVLLPAVCCLWFFYPLLFWIWYEFWQSGCYLVFWSYGGFSLLLRFCTLHTGWRQARPCRRLSVHLRILHMQFSLFVLVLWWFVWCRSHQTRW